MDILMIAHFTGSLDGTDNIRFIDICRKLVKHGGLSVELVTSDFSHGRKTAKAVKSDLFDFKIKLLHEPGYPKNICIKRLLSHREFGRNTAEYLKNRKKPDLIYCAVPSLSAAKAAADYCRKNQVRFIIDIQDLWPEAFRLVFKVPLLSDLLFAPMTARADAVYRQADEIVGVSQTYTDRALRVNKKCKKALPVFLGTSLSEFDKQAAKAEPESRASKEKIKLAYCGTLGASYDISVVLKAMRLMTNEELSDMEFVVMGDGPRRAEFEREAQGLPVRFTGFLPYHEMVSILSHCDIAVNPIRHGAAASIINKHGDYAMAGLPVLNTQESREYRNLVDEYNMGFNCKNGCAHDLADKLRILTANPSLRAEMGKNARRCAEERFDRDNTYNKIVNTILL